MQFFNWEIQIAALAPCYVARVIYNLNTIFSAFLGIFPYTMPWLMVTVAS